MAIVTQYLRTAAQRGRHIKLIVGKFTSLADDMAALDASSRALKSGQIFGATLKRAEPQFDISPDEVGTVVSIGMGPPPRRHDQVPIGAEASATPADNCLELANL